MTAIQIDPLSPADWQRHRQIRLRALSTDPDAFGSTLQREQDRTGEAWQQRLAESTAAIFVAHHENFGDVGLIAGAPFSDRDGVGLFSMWIAPEARGNGFSKVLVQSVIDWAKERRSKQLSLEVGDDNLVAIALYQRMGFKPSGRTSHLDPPRQHITEHELVLELNS